jgi:YD repeat-containing protein
VGYIPADHRQTISRQSDRTPTIQPGRQHQSFPLGSGTASAQLRSGNLTAHFLDATIPNQGLDAVIAHVYNSQRQSSVLHNNGLGQGWSLSAGGFDLAAPITAAKATVVDGAGTTSGFFLDFTDGDGTTHRVIRKGPIGARWDSPPGVDLRVREVISGTPAAVVAYEFIRPDGVISKVEDLKVVQPALNLSTNTWKVTSIRDRLGNTLTFDYNLAAGQVRLTTITHSRNGVVATLAWSSSTGRLTRITSLPGVNASEPVSGTSRSYERWVNFTYDAGGQLDQVTENAHSGSDAPRTTEFGYTNGLLTSVEDGRGHHTRFVHTGSGYSARLTSLTDRRQTPQPTPKPWTLTYDTPDPITGQQDTVVTSPEGNQVTSRTSGLTAIEPTGTDRRLAGGNLTGVTDAGYGSGPVMAEFEWTENRLTKRYQPRLVATPRLPTDPVWSYRYNDLGSLIEANEPPPNDPTRVDLPAGAGTATVTTRYSYQPVSASSPDTFRYPAGCVDPAPDTKTISEEGYCLAVMELAKTTEAVGDSAQRITDFAYNSNGTLASQTQRANSNGTPDAANDRTTTYAYYLRGGLKTIDGPRTDVTDVTTYGETTDATYGGYHRSGQPASVVDAANQTTTFLYSPYGPTVQVTDRDGRVTKSRYDDRDNLVQSVDPAGRHTTSTYDANDNRTRTTSPRGQSTPAPDDFTTISTYDNNDWLTEVSQPGANPSDPRRVSTISHADDGKKTGETTPRPDSQVNYTYTPNRSLKTVDAPGQTEALADRAVTDYAYDSVGRVTQLDGPVLNAAGQRPRTTTTYTPSGVVARQQVVANATQVQVTSFAYNAHGQVLRTDGPRTTPVAAQTSSVYNAFGEVTKTSRRIDTSRTLDSTIGYDRAGNQVQVIQPTGTGGLLEALYSYNAINRLSAQTKDPTNPTHTVIYTYDGQGNLTERLDKDGTTAARRVTTVYNPDGTVQSLVAKDEVAGNTLAECNYPAGAADLSSGYDADGNPLVTRTVSGTGGCATAGTTLKTQTFTYAAANDWMTTSTQTLRSPENGINYTCCRPGWMVGVRSDCLLMVWR